MTNRKRYTKKQTPEQKVIELAKQMGEELAKLGLEGKSFEVSLKAVSYDVGVYSILDKWIVKETKGQVVVRNNDWI